MCIEANIDMVHTESISISMENEAVTSNRSCMQYVLLYRMNVYCVCWFQNFICANLYALPLNWMDLEKFMRKLNRYGNVLMLFFIFETIAKSWAKQKKLKLDFMWMECVYESSVFDTMLAVRLTLSSFETFAKSKNCHLTAVGTVFSVGIN